MVRGEALRATIQHEAWIINCHTWDHSPNYNSTISTCPFTLQLIYFGLCGQGKGTTHCRQKSPLILVEVGIRYEREIWDQHGLSKGFLSSATVDLYFKTTKMTTVEFNESCLSKVRKKYWQCRMYVIMLVKYTTVLYDEHTCRKGGAFDLPAQSTVF